MLDLLSVNAKRNAPSCQVEKLLWGRTNFIEPFTIFGLKEPDFVLAADVVYGSDPEVWDALLETIKALSGSSTLVVIANVCGTQCDARPFYKMVQEDFKMKLLPQSLLHPDFRGDSVGPKPELLSVLLMCYISVNFCQIVCTCFAICWTLLLTWGHSFDICS